MVVQDFISLEKELHHVIPFSLLQFFFQLVFFNSSISISSSLPFLAVQRNMYFFERLHLIWLCFLSTSGPVMRTKAARLSVTQASAPVSYMCIDQLSVQLHEPDAPDV